MNNPHVFYFLIFWMHIYGQFWAHLDYYLHRISQSDLRDNQPVFLFDYIPFTKILSPSPRGGDKVPQNPRRRVATTFIRRRPSFTFVEGEPIPYRRHCSPVGGIWVQGNTKCVLNSGWQPDLSQKPFLLDKKSNRI